MILLGAICIDFSKFFSLKCDTKKNERGLCVNATTQEETRFKTF